MAVQRREHDLCDQADGAHAGEREHCLDRLEFMGETVITVGMARLAPALIGAGEARKALSWPCAGVRWLHPE